MRNSDVFSSHNPSTSSRPSTFAFALLTLLAVTSTPQTATASPVPVPVPRRTPFFLDFLYPEWYTAKTLSPASSEGDRQRIKPERSAATPGSSRPAAGAAGVRGFDTPQRQSPRPRASQQQPQQQRPRRRQLLAPTPASPPLAKRTTANGNLVPVKYESIDQAGGWVIDDTWDLHGHHRRVDNSTTNTNGSLDSSPVQNLDTTSNSTDPNSYIDTTDTIDTTDSTDDDLDLPFGWQEGGLNPRHESYDPVIVAVFAVILVLCIVATIGLCRWRARKLRRLRDLEGLEKEKEGGGLDDNTSENESIGDEDGSSESGSRFSEKKKKRSVIGGGSSSAIRNRFARFRRRHRDRAKRNAEEEKTSDTEREDQTPNDQVVRDGNDERTRTRPYAASIASSTTITLSRSSTSHRSRSSATLENSSTTPALGSNDPTTPIPITINGIPINGVEPEPDPPAIGSASERGRRSRRGGERPRITITSSEITPTQTLDPTMAMAMDMDMEAPNAEPPAYPASTSISNPHTTFNANTGDTRSTRRTRTRTPLETTPHLPLPPEKAPISGLEAEYDDRDLAGYSLHSGGGVGGLLAPNSNSGLFNSRLSTSGTGLSARSSAPPTRRPSRVRFAGDAVEGGAGGMQEGGENNTTDPEEEQVPSFEPFASSAGTSLGELGVLGASRAAAGATLRAHVATDDKGLLERLINVSSEPPLAPPPPLSPPPILGDSSGIPAHPDGRPAAATTFVAAAPSFSEIDQWELERQMAQAHHAHESASSTTDAESSSSFATRAIQPTLSGSSAFGPSSRRAGTSSNGFPALPAPPLPVFSTGGGGSSASGDVGYELGTVWNSLNVGVGTGVPSIPPGSSTSGSGNEKARVPSAPPLATPASALCPSAPPPMMLDEDLGANGQVMPSAPPAWDDDEEEEDGVNGGPILQPGTPSMEGHRPPDVDESRIAHQPNTIPLQDNEGDTGSDGDGAESVISTPPDNEEANSRWSVTFRTRPEDGAGLPRYEP